MDGWMDALVKAGLVILRLIEIDPALALYA
jgi:hypothetical protein